MPPIRSGFALLLFTLVVGPAAAQSVKITDVRVGLPGVNTTERDDNNRPAGIVKNGTWAPVYVDLQILREEKRPAAVVVEATDADDLGVSFAVPLQTLADQPPGAQIKGSELRYLPYLRPGGRYDVTVSVRVPGEGKPTDWRLLSEPYRVRYLRTRDVSKYVVLSLGGKLAGFTLPNEKTDDENAQFQQGGYRGGRIETAAVIVVNELPDRAIGYDAVDLIVLATGSADVNGFLTPLFTDPKHRPRLDALLEWVRGGGRLVVSVGANAQLCAQYELLQELLPAAIRKDEPATAVPDVSVEWAVGASNQRLGVLKASRGPFPVANLAQKADRGFRPMIPGDDAPANARRLAVQGAYGLGRVTVVAFDIDRSPFAEFPAKAKFFDLLLKEAGSPLASTPWKQKPNQYGGPGSDTEDEFAGGLRSHLDVFEGVPVISFGWVALFIVLYTLLIGPVEYLLLKKVFKRLELTWITFPIIVLTVSAIAYFTAYALKGSDLMVNKVDVVDVDPASNRVYGQTWYSVFSPRIETYRMGVDPNAGWAAANPDKPHPGGRVDWLGSARGGRGGGFFRRSYFYDLSPPGTQPQGGPFADGLMDVPIQVWSTKPFSGTWSAYLDKANPPVVSELIHPVSDPKKVFGKFTLNLPLPELKDAYLLYAGKAYKLDDAIVPGTPVTVLLDKPDDEWLQKVGNPSAVTSLAPRNEYDRNRTSYVSAGSAQLFGVLFHDAQPGGDDKARTNASLRRLDQSWRLSEGNRDEVIVVAKLPPQRAGIGDMTAQANSPVTARLWLKELPGGAYTPPAGTLSQETYVRVYVPVKPAARR